MCYCYWWKTPSVFTLLDNMEFPLKSWKISKSTKNKPITVGAYSIPSYLAWYRVALHVSSIRVFSRGSTNTSMSASCLLIWLLVMRWGDLKQCSLESHFKYQAVFGLPASIPCWLSPGERVRCVSLYFWRSELEGLRHISYWFVFMQKHM